MSCLLRPLHRVLTMGPWVMGQNRGAQDGTDTVGERMDLPSIPAPAIFMPLMVDGIFVIEINNPYLFVCR